MDLPLFGARDTYAEAGPRLKSIQPNVIAELIQLEQAAALWQIAYNLERIASVLEEGHS